MGGLIGVLQHLLEYSVNTAWVFYGGLLLSLFKIVPKLITNAVQKAFKNLLINDLEAIRQDISLLKEALLTITRYRLTRNAQRYLEQGCITIAQRDDLEHLYNSYKALGGNGTAEALYIQCKKLPTGKKHQKENKND